MCLTPYVLSVGFATTVRHKDTGGLARCGGLVFHCSVSWANVQAATATRVARLSRAAAPRPPVFPRAGWRPSEPPPSTRSSPPSATTCSSTGLPRASSSRSAPAVSHARWPPRHRCRPALAALPARPAQLAGLISAISAPALVARCPCGPAALARATRSTALAHRLARARVPRLASVSMPRLCDLYGYHALASGACSHRRHARQDHAAPGVQP